MKPGRLRHQVVLQSYSVAQNSYGEETKTYATIATVWASIEPLMGKELFAAQQTQANVNVRVRIRYSATAAGILPKYRVKFGSRYFEVVSVINTFERNKELQLMCVERV